MTLEEFLKWSGPNRKKNTGLLLIKLLAFDDTEKLRQLAAEFLVHRNALQKRFDNETDALKKSVLWLEFAALDYSKEVLETAPMVRENCEKIPGFDSAEIASTLEAAQREFQRLQDGN